MFFKRPLTEEKPLTMWIPPRKPLAVSIGEKGVRRFALAAELLDRPGQESGDCGGTSGVIFQNPAKSHGNAFSRSGNSRRISSGNVRKTSKKHGKPQIVTRPLQSMCSLLKNPGPRNWELPRLMCVSVQPGLIRLITPSSSMNS